MPLRSLILMVGAMAVAAGCNATGNRACCSTTPVCCSVSCCNEVVCEESVVYDDCSGCSSCGAIDAGAPCANGKCSAGGDYTTIYSGQFYTPQASGGCPNGRCNSAKSAPANALPSAQSADGDETVDDFLPSVLSEDGI